ncbi:MAG TPA: glycerate kinase, partial [Longimicrobiales bacterium]
TIAASAAAHAMASGAQAVTSEALIIQPLSDGGPGLIDALQTRGGSIHETTVRAPLGNQVRARILVQQNTAIIESAEACGLHLVPKEQRDPTQLDTYGVGQLLRAASELPVERIVIGLGGSATVDGGVGMASALERDPIPQRITALADVNTRLRDAARIFGPQKGATPAQVQLLEAALAKLVEMTGVPDFPGAGAAGGLAYGLHAFLKAEVVSGSAWVMDVTGVVETMRSARAVITGEGAYDEQSFMGKITGALVERAGEHGIPVLVITGSAAARDGYARVATNEGAPLTERDIERLVREHLPALLGS